MRKVLILILAIFLIFPVSGIRHEVYSETGYSDEGIYLYFSKLLKDVEKSLDMFLDEDSSALNISKRIYNEIKLTDEECKFYAAKNVKSNVSIAIKPFIPLSDGIKKMAKFQSIFLKNIGLLFENKNNYSAYLNARSALMNMELAVDEVDDSVNEIEQIGLWNGTSKLYFDVSGLKSKLKDVYGLIAYYESLLTRFEKEGLIVVVSDDHPFLYQEITIYVYAKNVTPVSLFIDDIEYELKNSTKKHSFEELGEHTIYAKGLNNSKIIKSNVVKIYVSKIPTHIFLSSKSVAFLNENVSVTGYLSDCYSNPVKANVTVKIDGEETELSTHNGFFRFNVTKSSEGFLNISAYYFGNKIHSGSSASTSILFSRYPVSILIEANKTRTSVNETVNFVGKIDGVSYPVPIHVFVNSTKIKILNATKKFNFTLNFSNSGTYVVFTRFPGNSMYKPAESNKIKVVVNSNSISQKLVIVKTFRNSYIFLLIVVLVTIIASVYAVYVKSIRGNIDLNARYVEKDKGERLERIERTDKGLKLPESVEEAYMIIFNTLTNKYNLKKSLTPRELLKSLKSESFAKKLYTVTQLHEKAVYGKIKLKDEEKKIYFKFIADILEEVR